MRYTWRPEKYRRNLKTHGLAFEDTVRIFEGPTVEQEDTRFDYGEIRVVMPRRKEVVTICNC